MKVAVVLFNLGGPDGPDAIEPFLRNLFSDPAILPLPSLLRVPLAKFIAARRAPVAGKIYAKIGGSSPILTQTLAQAAALEATLGRNFRVFVAMRCWKPFSDQAVAEIAAWGADRIVLLPLYPQYSVTTSASSFADWDRAARGVRIPTVRIDSYPVMNGFILALADLIRLGVAKMKAGISYRLLLSAHGLPERIIRRGDPYRRQVEATVAALKKKIAIDDVVLCYQSKVGPVKWIGPPIDREIERAGREGLGVMVAPVAFVSEHSETLVELDMEYAELAEACGVKDYMRVPAVGCHPDFITGLAELAMAALRGDLPPIDGLAR
jgi:protoporphyrin/coproporphyrin ferrochelatase